MANAGARRRACAGGVVVGEHPTRRSRPEPASPHIGTADRALVAVTGPARRSRYDLRVPAQMRRYGDEVIREPVLLRLSPGRSPPQGALLELTGELRRRGGQVTVSTSAPGYVATASRRRPRIALANHRASRRALGLRRRPPCPAGPLDGAGARRRAAGGHRRDRARGRRGVVGQPAGTVPGLGPLPPARGIGSERCPHRRWRAPVRVPDRASRVLGEVLALGAIGGYVLAVGWQPSVVRAGIAGALASLAWLAARPHDHW